MDIFRLAACVLLVRAQQLIGFLYILHLVPYGGFISRSNIFTNFTELLLCTKILLANNDPASFPDVKLQFRKIFIRENHNYHPFTKVYDRGINPLIIRYLSTICGIALLNPRDRALRNEFRCAIREGHLSSNRRECLGGLLPVCALTAPQVYLISIY